VEFAILHEIIDPYPMSRAHRPVGSWERPGASALLAKASPWYALL
jgi:hypothetical protein